MNKFRFILLFATAALFALSCEKNDEPDTPNTPQHEAGTVLDDISGLTVKTSYSTVDLSWNAVDGATGYQVTYNSTDEVVTTNSFSISGLDLNTTVDYSIVALSEDGDEYNSAAITGSARTLNAFIYETTTSTIVLEIEQDGDDHEYQFQIENASGTVAKSFTYDYIDANNPDESGYQDGMPLRFVFHYIGDTWADAYLNQGETYNVKVKNTAYGKEWSKLIPATLKTHEARSNEIFYEDFDLGLGTDAVALAAGPKCTTMPVEDDYTRDLIFTVYKCYYWHNGGGSAATSGGTYHDPYRLGFFKDDGWATGALDGSDTHNWFAGCFRIGGNNTNQSYIATPELGAYFPNNEESIDINLTFKTACNVSYSLTGASEPGFTFDGNWWQDKFDACEIYILHEDGTTGYDSGVINVGTDGAQFTWKSQSLDITGVLPTDKILFSQAPSKCCRYYLDEISVAVK